MGGLTEDRDRQDKEDINKEELIEPVSKDGGPNVWNTAYLEVTQVGSRRI